MINGGGSATQNFQSHFLHIEQLVSLLASAKIPPDHVSIFSADGEDPAPDLAVREVRPEVSFWLFKGTRLEHSLAPTTLTNSAIPGVTLGAATRENLRSWFRRARGRLRPGDTLLLYVTDHGTQNREDPSNNRITLWGKDEWMSVSELGELLGRLSPQVRVVALMSQCFSGGFARLASVRGGQAAGGTCGFFSSTADRPAYGCYPENRGVENLGHSFEFFRALVATGSFPRAHEEVLVRDETPDVPIRSSDVQMEEMLRGVASERGKDFTPLVDELLQEAWRDRAGWEPEIRLLDRIGHAYGFFSPRALSEIEQQVRRLPEVADQIRRQAKAWKAALDDLRRANLERFLAGEPEWTRRTSSTALHDLDTPARDGLRREVAAELERFTTDDRATGTRLDLLKTKADAASAAAYRMEVRSGVVLRMRAVLLRIAGRQFLRQAPPQQRMIDERLEACEDLKIDFNGVPSLPSRPEPPVPFPLYDDDLRAADDFLPAWMGIRFEPVEQKSRTRLGLSEGAAKVTAVYPDSPAERGGFQPGDIVVGRPQAPFTTRNQVREWTMLSKIGERTTLEILRDDRKLELALTPAPFPRKWPELPGPPKTGSVAPALELSAYRGTVPASFDGHAHLLFFWATWCAPCKAALPEVLAFEAERGTAVIAITDESREDLDAFFQRYQGPFPSIVATDARRQSFLAYGVSGTPTFVLVGEDGKVGAYSTGYSPEKHLGIEGWSWSGRPRE